jgi:RNA polymerase sigma-70 factor, ECF subfamily
MNLPRTKGEPSMKGTLTGPATVEGSEGDAITRAQRGDPEAFESLYKAHSKRVYSVCLRMIRNPAEAEDLTQQAFLQLFRKIGTFRGESGFSTWLHRVTVNVVLMHLRRKEADGNPHRRPEPAWLGARRCARTMS